MEFTITEGLDIVSIGLGEIGSYLNFYNPVSVTWYDCRGSIGKYLCLIPYNASYRKELRNRVIDSLNVDFSDNIEVLYEKLKPLPQIFPSGNYSLTFYNSNEKAFFAYKTSSDNYSKEQDDESADFALDGHHKLLASEFLQNSNSSIHNFIKNGQVREFYKNGQLKHEAYYINDKIYGESRGWLDNGQLEYEHFYDNGIRVGLWKDWYKSGKIKYVQPFNDRGKYNGHLVSYYENGQIRWEKFLKNGINEDGMSYLSWFENGNKEAQLKYLSGRMIERKKWNLKGRAL